MFIKEIMTKDVITVSPDASLKEVGSIFKEKRISGAPVVNRDGYIVGIVTLTDLLKILGQIYRCKEVEERFTGLKLSKMHEEEKTKTKVRDIMTKDIVTISEDRTIDDVMKLMFDKGIHTFPVIKEDKLIGIVGKRDLIDACF
jgi:CBS domain-containing protein